jgi:ech hydrogenase subunit D
MPQIEFLEITPVELLNRVIDLKAQGCRIVQICCSKKGDALELDYSFDRDYQLIDIKMTVQKEDEIASISAVFPPAFLYENEIEALFGLKILHKSVDFGGKLYQTAQKTPFMPKDGE